MGKRKKFAELVVDGFTWVQLSKGGERIVGGGETKERWELLGYSGVVVRICNYGDGDDKYRSGWRVVAGAPEKERWESREEAMENARKTIVSETKNKLDAAHIELNRIREMAKRLEMLP